MARIRDALQRGDHIVRRTREKDLAAGLEQLGKAFPDIGDDGGRARCSLEQADGGGPAGLDHVVAGDVEGEARRGVEGGVLGRSDMVDALDVGGPVDGVRVLRTGDAEAAVRQCPGGGVQ